MRLHFKHLILLAAICLVLSGCIEFKDILIHVQLQADGSVLTTVYASGLSEKRDDRTLPRAELIESLKAECVKKAQESSAEKLLVRCEPDRGPSFLGDRNKSSKQVDGYYTWHYAKAVDFFQEMEASKAEGAAPGELTFTKTNVRIRSTADVGGKEKSCTMMIQSPWPITKTNADVLIGSHHLAVWNCTGKEGKLPIVLEAGD